EKVLDDPPDLLPVHQEETAPPALELQEAFGLCVNLREERVVLVEVRVGRVEIFEVLDEVGPIELAGAKVACQERRPKATKDSTRIAHWVLAVIACPIRHRRPIDDDGTDEIRFDGANQ